MRKIKKNKEIYFVLKLRCVKKTMTIQDLSPSILKSAKAMKKLIYKRRKIVKVKENTEKNFEQ